MSIKPKKNKCTGTGKAKGFDSCGGMFYERTYGLCNKCYSKWLLNTPEGREKLSNATIKATSERKEVERERKQSQQRKRLRTQLTTTRNKCHEYIRERDKGKPCVSCGTPWNPTFQAGHLYKAELYSSLKFDERNVHGQCKGCNLHKNGNEQKYAERVHLRIGHEGKAQLDQDAIKYKQESFKWDAEELKKVYEYYKEKLKLLKD